MREYSLSSLDCNSSSSIGKISQFTCLITNCTQLMKNTTLGESFSKLPIFSLCHPNASKTFTPIKDIDSPGLLISSISSFGIFLLGSLFPLVQTFFPVSDTLIMFVVAPRLTTDLVQQRAKLILLELSDSYKNFYPLIEEVQQSRGHFQSSVKYNKTLIKPRVYAESIRRRLNNFLHDCIPAVRTQWWRLQLAKSITILFIVIFPVGCALGFWFFYFIYVNILRKEELFVDISEQVSGSRCAIWSILDQDLTNSSTNSNQCPFGEPKSQEQLVRLDQMNLRWSWLLLIQTATIHTTPTWSMAMLLAYYLATNCELTCWLSELSQQMRLASNLSKLQRFIPKGDIQLRELSAILTNKGDKFSDGHMFSLRAITGQFIDNTEINIMILNSKPLGWKTQLVNYPTTICN